MKILLPALIIGNLFTCALPAADPLPGAAPERKQSDKIPQWNVRVEVMMVAMPQDKALALLPDLRSPEKIEGAVAQILSAIERKEATLKGYPIACLLDGDRGVSETILEKRYPTEFDAPATPQNAGVAPEPAPAENLVADNTTPTAFETRNLGETLEVEAHVIPPGASIRLVVVPQRVALLGFDTFDAAKTQSGKTVKIDQPRFGTTKTTASIIVRSGQRYLLAFQKLSEDENNQIEISILQAFASPTK